MLTETHVASTCIVGHGNDIFQLFPLGQRGEKGFWDTRQSESCDGAL